MLTTFNGSKYVIEQLDSLRLQIRRPDEVLVLDDCSKDNTVSIIKTYVERYHLNNWIIIVNPKNKGWKVNFFNGIISASGDLIFPCDQDDIWHCDKISSMSEVMEHHPEIDVLVGRHHTWYPEGKKNQGGLWQKAALISDSFNELREKKKETNKVIKRKFDRSFLSLEPGCCYCFRKTFVNSIKEYWIPEYGHDAWLTYYSELKESLYYYDKVVIEWRHHYGSTSRPVTRNKDVRISEIDRNKKVLSLMKSFLLKNKFEDYDKKMFLLDKAIKWNLIREEFVRTGKVIDGFRLIPYYSFYDHKRAILSDWVYANKYY
ncbi:MAG: glycosyltransferase [Stecheria intestinalis]|nr:glycosyltransferase [Stecheria intestinalis]